MVAFSNSKGGAIYIGVDDSGKPVGLPADAVSRINQLISNAASQHVRSPISPTTENVSVGTSKIIIVLTVPEGLDKPYFDKNGVIWLKSGSDKRRVNSKEELRRIFQIADQLHADELPTKAGIDKIDKLRFRDFLQDFFKQTFPDSRAELVRLLQNMNLATESGMLNLAGVLLFAEKPELIKPQFVVKAIKFPGNQIHVSDYEDTEDFVGPLSKIFEDTLAFVMRNLHKIQAGRGVNSPGTPEIPVGVFEELLVNALMHRDYLVSAPIRLFIFDNRIEIISPGHLPNNLTVEKIRTGNSNIRNPILVSYAAKGLLPYHGLGSGIKRALEEWPNIDFVDDQEGCLFTVTVHRNLKVQVGPENDPKKDANDLKNSLLGSLEQKNDPKNSRHDPKKTLEMSIIEMMHADKAITYDQIAEKLSIGQSTAKRAIGRLRKTKLVRRTGGKKGGFWEVSQTEIDGTGGM